MHYRQVVEPVRLMPHAAKVPRAEVPACDLQDRMPSWGLHFSPFNECYTDSRQPKRTEKARAETPQGLLDHSQPSSTVTIIAQLKDGRGEEGVGSCRHWP